jgi:two-component system response regulator DevR
VTPIRVLLVDNHPLVRRGLRTSLDPDPRFEVIGEAATAAEALRLVAEERPDVVLLDLRLSPGGSKKSGSALCRELLQASPRSAVIVLTAFIEPELVEDCLRAGARGYLLKHAESLRLREQILTVVAGHVALDPRAADVLADRVRRGDPPPELLSPRELGVLRLIAQGLTNREIAGQLFLSEYTVKGHVKEILAKLEARNRVEAALRARERGMV